ncbi:MAG: tetratricopeptide repeat protein [Bacteroidetes bacterium]|nr:MAG: tetratricopeptide repeat protein [Bacteroidota bacterium]
MTLRLLCKRLAEHFIPIILLVLLSGTSAAADTLPGEQIQQELAHAREQKDSLQMARTLRTIGVEFMYASRIDSALVYLNEALEIASALSHDRAMAAIYNNIADCYSQLGDSQKAFELYDEVGRIYLGIPDSTGYAGFLINLASELQEAGQTAEAVERAVLAINIKEQTGDSTQLAFFYNKMAELLENSNPESARSWLMRAYGLIHTPQYTAFNTNITIYNNLAKMYRDLQEYELALIYYDSVYVVAKNHGHHNGMEVGLSNLAMLNAQLGDTVQALYLHRKAIEISAQGQNMYRRTGHFINVGRFESALGNPQRALPMLLQGLAFANEFDYPEYKIEALEALSVVYQNIEQWQQALETFRVYVELKDSLEGIELKATILDLEKFYESEKKEKEILLLRAENEISLKRKRLFTAVSVSGLLLISALSLIARLRFVRLKQQKQISEQRREIYCLNQQNLKHNMEYKNRELSTLALQMVQKTEFLNDFKKELILTDSENTRNHVARIDMQINRSDQWDKFRLHFQEVHPDFFKKLKQQFPSLTPNEEKLCAFIKMNLSNKEIALINSNTTAAVDKSRNRLRKKLALTPDQKLRDFIAGF